MKRRSVLHAALAAPLLVHSGVLAAAPSADLWPFWQTQDSDSTQRVDHGVWQALLDRYLKTGLADGIHRVDYAAFTAEDRNRLTSYLNTLQATDPRSLVRDEQLPYWINLYNALTVDLILRKQPKKSIKQTGEGWFSFGPWDDKLARIAGQALTLNDIEHRILRPIWNDPRIHFVVNCASLGCPNLQPIAFTRENTGHLMQAAAQEYLAHPRGARFEDDTAVVSSLFDWYVADFGGSESAMLKQIATYAPPQKAKRLRNHQGPVRYTYDWALNRFSN